MANVAEIIEREIAQVSRFVALLKDEQAILQRADVASLEKTAIGKSELVESLNNLEQERRLALGNTGGKDARDTMAAWLTQHPENPTTAVNWKKLLKLAGMAKELHEHNAGLLNIHLQQTSEALAILTWQVERSTLYGSNGQATQTTGSRIVDSA